MVHLRPSKLTIGDVVAVAAKSKNEIWIGKVESQKQKEVDVCWLENFQFQITAFENVTKWSIKMKCLLNIWIME